MATYFPAGALVVDSVTKTVGVAGDFVTIQGAVDWFKNKIITGLCKIDVDAGSYDEVVVFEDLFIAKSGALELEGDTRVLAGISYVDGADCNRAGLANGGTGTVTLSTNLARDEITVVMTVANPDFNADGWGNGDDILVFADDGVLYERVIDSISPGGAGNHVIGITVALPAGASLGNDATAICLLPDRQIVLSGAGTCMTVDAARGVLLDGWYLKSGGAGEAAFIGQARANIEAENFATYGTRWGISLHTMTMMDAGGGAVSSWGSDREAIRAQEGAILDVTFAVVVNARDGFRAMRHSSLIATSSTSCNNTRYAYYALRFAFLDAGNATARQNTVTGYQANSVSYIYAMFTNARNLGNGADYSPAVSCTPGNCEAVIEWS